MCVKYQKDWESIGPLVEYIYELGQSDFDITIQEYSKIDCFVLNLSQNIQF